MRSVWFFTSVYILQDNYIMLIKKYLEEFTSMLMVISVLPIAPGTQILVVWDAAVVVGTLVIGAVVVGAVVVGAVMVNCTLISCRRRPKRRR